MMRLHLFSAGRSGSDVKLVLAGPYAGEVVEVVMTPEQARGLASSLGRVALPDSEAVPEEGGLGIGYFLRVRAFLGQSPADLEGKVNEYLAQQGAAWVREVQFLLAGDMEYLAFVVEEVEAEGD